MLEHTATIEICFHSKADKLKTESNNCQRSMSTTKNKDQVVKANNIVITQFTA